MVYPRLTSLSPHARKDKGISVRRKALRFVSQSSLQLFEVERGLIKSALISSAL